MVPNDYSKIFEGYTGSKEYEVMRDHVCRIFPKCYQQCFEKIFDYGCRYGLKLTKIGEKSIQGEEGKFNCIVLILEKCKKKDELKIKRQLVQFWLISGIVYTLIH